MRFFDIIPRLNRSQLDRDLRRLQEERHNINVNANVNGNNNVDNLHHNLNNLNNTGRDSSKIFSDLRIKMGLYLTAIKAVNDATRGAIKTIKSYDDYTTDLSMAMGSTREEAEKYLVTLSQQGKELKATTAEMAEGADSFIRQGKSMSETETLIQNSMVLSKVAKMDSADSTDVLTAAMNSFNIAAEDTISVVDKLTSVDLVSASSANGLGIALGKSASAAKLAGIEIDKLISMLAVMKEAAPAESDETIGNAMKSILSRMNQVKADKFTDEETGEALNDVEKVLSKVGIAMRDVNGQFIESEKVLDEVGQKWSSFDSVTQRAVSTAIAGSYQYNRFISLMDGYSKVLEYTEVAQNSSGQAMEKFQNYEESLEAKTKLLQNSLESLAYDTFGNEFYGSVLDATTSLVQFTEKTEVLKTGLTALGIVSGAKVFATIATFIVGAVKHLNDFNTALSIIKNGNVASSFSTLLACTEGLNASQLKLILSSQALTNEQRVAILVRRGYTEEEIAATLATLNLANAEGVATASTATLAGTVKGLGASLRALAVANPVMTALTALGMVVFGAVKAYDALTLSAEEANEAMDNAISKYEESKSKLESINSQLTEQQKAMDELLGKDKLTYAEKGQLEELQKITEELRLQQDIAERQAEADAKEVAKTTVQAYDKQYGKYDISKDKTEEKIAHMEETGVTIASGGDDDVSGKLAELVNFNRLLDETEEKLNNIDTSDLSEDEVKILESNYQDYKDFVEKLENEISDSLSDLEEKRQSLADGCTYALEKQSNGETLSTTEKDTLTTYEAIANAIKLIYEYTDPNAWNNLEVSKIFNTEDIGTTKEELIELAKAGTLSPATLASYTALSNVVQDSELILEDGQTAYSAFCDEIYALAEAQEDAAGTFEENPIEANLSISQTIDNLNTQLKPTFDALKDAYQDIFKSEDGKIKFSLDDVDISTFESIKSAIDELNEIEGVDVNYNDFDNFVKVLSDTSSTSDEVQDQFDKLATSIVYSSDCTEMTKDNFDLLCKSLYEMGLTNAPEVLKNIRAAQEELKASGIDLKNVTEEDAQAFLNEAEASEIAKEYLRMYMIQKQLANQPLNTSADVEALENLCNSLGVTGEMLKWVASLKSALGAVEAGANIQAFQTQIDTANQKIQELAATGGSFSFDFDTNVTSPSSSGNSGSGSDSSSSPSEVTQEFNWIQTYLESFARKTEKIMNRISDYLSFKKNLSTIKSSIKAVRTELTANEKALAEYERQMASVGLSQTYIDKIKNGELSIETITGYETDGVKDANAQLIDKIEKYQELYDQYTSIEDTIEDLRDTEREWLVKNLEYINDYYQKLSDIKSLAIDTKQDDIDLKEAQGERVTSGDYNSLISNNDAYIKSLKKNYKKTNAEFNKLVKNGTIEKESAEWFEWTETLADLNSEIVKAQINTAEWKDEINQIKINNYTSSLDRLEAKYDKLNTSISRKESSNIVVTQSDYNKVIKNLDQQITKNNKLLTLYKQLQSQTEKNSEKWREYQELIEQTESTVESLRDSIIETAQKIADIIAELRDLKLEDNENASNLLSAKYDNATTASERNKILDEQDALAKSNLEINNQAYKDYTDQAKNLGKQLSQYISNATKDTSEAKSLINDTSSDLVKERENYSSYVSSYEKAQEKYSKAKTKAEKSSAETEMKKWSVMMDESTQKIKALEATLVSYNTGLEENQSILSQLDGYEFGKEIDLSKITDEEILKVAAQYNETLKQQKQALIDAGLSEQEAIKVLRENASQRIQNILDEAEALDVLNQAMKNQIKSKMDLNKTQGYTISDTEYKNYIGEVSEGIKLYEEKYKEALEQFNKNLQSGVYKDNEELYLKDKANIEALKTSIYDAYAENESMLDEILQLRIDALTEEKEAIQKLYDLQQRRYKLEEAQYNLEKAKQRTNLVYNGDEFIYKADTDELKAAEKALQEAKYNELINKIDDWIQAMEDAKEDFNLYDADGNPLGSTEDIINAAMKFGDDLLDGLEKIFKLNNLEYSDGELKQIQTFADGGVVGKSQDSKFDAIAKSLEEDKLVAVKDGEMILTKAQGDELYKKLVGTAPVPVVNVKPVIPDNLVKVNTTPNISVDMSGMQFNQVQNMDQFTREIQKMAQKASSMIDMELGKRKM